MEGFVAGIVMFIAAATVCIAIRDDLVIRSTNKGQKKYKF